MNRRPSVRWSTTPFFSILTSIVAIAVVWRILLGTDTGLINGLLDQVGITGPGWLTDPSWALPSIMIMTTWKGIGLQMIILLAGLQSIDESLYEAAKIDGAGAWQRLRKITIPLDVSPPFHFSPIVPGIQVNKTRMPFRMSATPAVKRPANLEDVAFWPVRHLAELIAHAVRQMVAVTSVLTSEKSYA